MGQKVHPESMRVGYIHDWKSNWFNERNFADYLAEDIAIREHIQNKLAHAGLSDITIRKDANEVEVNIHTARPGHRDRQVRRGGRRPAQGPAPHDAQADQGQHPRDQAPRARRQARRAVDRRAAAEPRRLPPRDEARAHQRDALRREGLQGPGRRPPRRRRDGAHRELLRRPRAAAHDARRHRLRLLRGPHDVRPHRRQVLDQQGRDHARGLHRRRPDRDGRALARSRATATGRDGRGRGRGDRGGDRGDRGGGPGGRGGRWPRWRRRWRWRRSAVAAAAGRGPGGGR